MDLTWSSPRGSNRTLKGSKETPALTGLIMDNILPTVISMPSQLNLDLIYKVNTNILVYVIWVCPGFLGPTWSDFARDSWDQIGLILARISWTSFVLFCRDSWDQFGLILPGIPGTSLVLFCPGGVLEQTCSDYTHAAQGGPIFSAKHPESRGPKR